MTIKIGGATGFEFDINGLGLLVRLPWIGEAYVCFTNRRLTAFNRLR